MSTLTLGIVVILYMFVIAWLGYIGYKQTKNASDYLLGGRKVNPIIMALSYGATFISASAIVGFGGVAATFGMGIQWLCLLNMFMGVVVAFIFFGRRTRKLGEQHNARTFPQLLGMHYKSRSIQIFIATIIFIGMPVTNFSSIRFSHIRIPCNKLRIINCFVCKISPVKCQITKRFFRN